MWAQGSRQLSETYVAWTRHSQQQGWEVERILNSHVNSHQSLVWRGRPMISALLREEEELSAIFSYISSSSPLCNLIAKEQLNTQLSSL